MGKPNPTFWKEYSWMPGKKKARRVAWEHLLPPVVAYSSNETLSLWIGDADESVLVLTHDVPPNVCGLSWMRHAYANAIASASASASASPSASTSAYGAIVGGGSGESGESGESGGARATLTTAGAPRFFAMGWRVKGDDERVTCPLGEGAVPRRIDIVN